MLLSLVDNDDDDDEPPPDILPLLILLFLHLKRKMDGIQWRGIGSVLGSFLIQLTIGSFVGTFGNMLPYLTSYMRSEEAHVTNGDLALVQAGGGMAGGIILMMSGLVFIPYLSLRGCLFVACVLYTIAPLLTYWSLSHGLPYVVVSYGVLSASAMDMAMVPTLLIPTAWFPNHRGKVLGFIQAGFGLSSTVFTPVQTFLINPGNIPPSNDDEITENDGNTNATIKYFTDETVLQRIPIACLYIGAVYGCILLVGFLLAVEPPKDTVSQPQLEVHKDASRQPLLEPPKATLNQSQLGSRSSNVRKALRYLVRNTFTRLDFYLLFATRLFMLVVVGGLLGHWKTVSLTVTNDDHLISIIGSFSGILNCLSRLVTGLLMDHLSFRQVMPTIGILLAVALSNLVVVAKINLGGFVFFLLLCYGLAFAFNTSIPIQVIKLFGHDNSNVVIGAIGLSGTLSFFILGVLNQIFLTSSEDINSLFKFFLCIAGFAGATVVVTALVSVNPKKKSPEEECLISSNKRPSYTA